MKVLLITVRSDIGGGPKHISDLLSHGGNAVDYYIAAPIDQFFSENFKKLAHEFIGIPFRKFSLLAFIRLLLFLKKNEINIIHSHGRGAGLYSRLLKLFGYKVIHTFHGVHTEGNLAGRIKLLIDKILAPLTDKFICVSDGEFKKAIKNKVMNVKRGTVITNGVVINDFNSKAESTPIVIGSLTRLSNQKGIDILVEYIDRYRANNEINFIIKIAGDGEERANLEELIRHKDLIHIINLLGPTSEPQNFLNTIDIYLSFSREEGMPLSVLEAVSSSVPCILSNVVGNNDIIINDTMGYLFDLNNYEDFNKQLGMVLSNREERVARSLKAYEYLKENFSVEKMVKETIKVYQ